MEVSNALAGRPAYYDRATAGTSKGYGANGIAPHADTQRWNYTVPSNKGAIWETNYLECRRATAAGVVGTVDAYCTYTVSGGSTRTIDDRSFNTNVVGDKDKGLITNLGILYAGDAVAGFTADTSTTGTCNYQMGAKFVEFTA